MRRAHGSHVVCSFAEQMRATYMQLSTAGASPPPLLPAAFPPCGNLFPQTDVAPLSPRAGPHCFPAYANVHGCYDPPRIVYWFDRVHIGGVAEACFVSSSLGPRIATPGLGSSPPPSIPVHWQSASPPPLLSAHLSIWPLASHQALSSDRAFFCPGGGRALRFKARLTTCRCVHRMAGM